jgi:uncharacterized protein (TIGR03435 family)
VVKDDNAIMANRVLKLLLMTAGLAPLALSAAPAFDAASIRLSALWKPGGEGGRRSKIEYTTKSLSMSNVDLSDCVQWAYGVPFYQVSGPDFPDSERYDILARTEQPVSVSQLRLMLQSLLKTRFHLALRREQQMLPVYDLVVAKRGPKLPARKADSDLSPGHADESLPRVQDGGFLFQNVSMAGFAAKLSMLRGIERPVIDQTHIDGVYDVTLKFAASAILRPDGVSLFTLIQEQLGLRLISAKAPMEILVIEHVSRPSEN